MSEVNKKLNLATHEPDLPCNCKRFDCYNITSERDKKDILHQFNGLQSHDEQNRYLGGLITVMSVAQRRPRKDEDVAKFRDACYTYRVHVGSEAVAVQDVEACAKAF
ncbi:hypothetical protein PR048_020081 [Dryococelus australis]|uniref:Uncharacterized protein n=1 Tax=Dryococelus australis TaxID=614101 RepID=A0ABQ9H5N5_9NEOP|nr:hypothetical protein PR048_020081 [Dryococelus australis]